MKFVSLILANTDQEFSVNPALVRYLIGRTALKPMTTIVFDKEQSIVVSGTVAEIAEKLSI